jgi:UrcA family protein
MKHSNRKSRLALLAGAALFSAGAWSLPPEDTVTRSEVVKYDPREAATPEGAAALYARLHHAAARVCDEPAGMARDGLTAVAPYSACVQAALSGAVRELRVPLVSRIHQEGMRHPEASLASR